MIRFINIFLFLFFISIVNSQPCPNNLNGSNNNNNPVTLYIYNINNEVIGTITCNQAGNGSMNCDLSNLPSGASYLSFGNININDDLGACLYDTSGVSIGGGLPIELITFNIYPISDYNLIQWSTASEMNNDRFVLEYSDNGFNWETIGVIKGSGNSSSRIDYSFEHRDFSNNINYYRLTQIDFDGQNETFNIISIDNRLNKKIMKVFNMMGQEVDINSKGLKVIIYDDGSSSKKMN